MRYVTEGSLLATWRHETVQDVRALEKRQRVRDLLYSYVLRMAHQKKMSHQEKMEHHEGMNLGTTSVVERIGRNKT